PWFEYYKDSLLELYQRPYAFLVDWNLACFEWAVAQIGRMDLAISLTSSFQATYNLEEYLDLRNKILPGNYHQETGPKYRQVFEEKWGFFPNLSILDLLFCEGKRAGEILWPGGNSDE
ncbi:MAG: WbqC family protein, partial [Chitinophagales bacterium]